MATTLVLHIGDPKTGSSSIQSILFEKQWVCDSRSLDYPATMNAFQLVNALKPDARPGLADARFGDYATWLSASQADFAVISAETFAQMDPTTVQSAMQRYFPDHFATMRVVAYARPHVSRFLSAYVQRTKVAQLNISPEEFLEKAASKDILGYHDRFSKWRDVFGSGFQLRPMERDALRDGDVVADFLATVLGDTPFRITGPTQTNSSMSLEALAGLRLMQNILGRFKLRGNTQHAIGARINTLLAEAGATGTKLRLSQAMFDTLHGLCAEDAARLDRDFFDTPVMSRAFEKAAGDTVPTPQDWAAKELLPPATLRALRQNARRLGNLFQDHPGVWEAVDRRAKGYDRPLPKDAATARAQAKVIARTDAILAETVALLAMAPAPTITRGDDPFSIEE